MEEKLLNGIHREALRLLFPRNLECLEFRVLFYFEENQGTQRKILGKTKDENQQQTQPTYATLQVYFFP